MSTLEFDGLKHRVTLQDQDGKSMGSWSAYNHIDSHASLQPHIPDGVYEVIDRKAPHPHPANPDGPYGSYGIIRFKVPGHVGIGLHSGRAHAKYQPGPQHATMGCIRTTDDAMAYISQYIGTHPLTTFSVSWNTQADAQHSTRKHMADAHARP